MTPPPRSRQQRKSDTLSRLERDTDAWVATADGAGGAPYLIPLSFLWDGATLLVATPSSSPTSRNLQATGKVRVGIGPTRDVVLIEGTVHALAAADLPNEVGDAFAAKTGFDPRRLSSTYLYFRIQPQRLQAWREANELEGRDLILGGHWLDGNQTRVEEPRGSPVELLEPTPSAGRPGALSAPDFELRPIGHVESPLLERESAPKQGDEGAPHAWLVFDDAMSAGLHDLELGSEVIVLTWLDRASRDVLRVHPRGDPANPMQGVFSTRSPDRPNPIGLHRVRILSIEANRILVADLEALDGTPILDVKPVLGERGER